MAIDRRKSKRHMPAVGTYQRKGGTITVSKSQSGIMVNCDCGNHNPRLENKKRIVGKCIHVLRFTGRK